MLVEQHANRTILELEACVDELSILIDATARLLQIVAAVDAAG